MEMKIQIQKQNDSATRFVVVSPTRLLNRCELHEL